MEERLINTKELADHLVTKGYNGCFSFLTVDGKIEFTEKLQAGFAKVDNMLKQQQPYKFYVSGFPVWSGEDKPHAAISLHCLYHAGTIQIFELNVSYMSAGPGRCRQASTDLIHPKLIDIPDCTAVIGKLHRLNQPHNIYRNRSKRKL